MGRVYEKMNSDRGHPEHAERAASAGPQRPPCRVYFLANSLPINRLN